MAYGSALVDTVQSSTASTPVVFKDGNGTQIGTLCRAWVNFDGTTSPATIRGSFNVSSVTRNSQGIYTVNFTTNMPDTNYSVTSAANSYASDSSYSGNLQICKDGTYSTSAVQFLYGFGNGYQIYDVAKACVAVFR